MDADGKNVKRLTSTPGYDGGAFFSADCSKIVWRASRPHGQGRSRTIKALLSQNLVRPSKLELYVAQRRRLRRAQVTYLDAASFAPFLLPARKRILFSSNHGDPKGREFDIWSITLDGTGLERITYAPGFDGFPMFSPDGKTLAFSSNRATPKGKRDTNVFLARWVEEGSGPKAEQAADRVMSDISWLADPAREGRGIGMKGLEQSGAYLEERFKALGLAPAGDPTTAYRQAFPVVTSLKSEEATALRIDGKTIAKEDYTVLGYSPSKADVRGDMVLAGYGIVAKDAAVDDYAKLDVKKKIVVVRRFAPEGGKLGSTEAQRRFGDIRRKAFTAREKGASALLVIDEPAPPEGAKADWKAPDEAKLPPLMPEGYSDAGLPVVVLKRSVGKALVERLAKKGRAAAALEIELSPVSQSAFNVVGRVSAEPADGKKLPGVVVVGAHYDHLGKGGRHSLAPLCRGAARGRGRQRVRRRRAARGRARRRAPQESAQARRRVRRLLGRGVGRARLGTPRPRVDEGREVQGQARGRGRHAQHGHGRPHARKPPPGPRRETAAEWKDLVQTACDRSRVDCAMSGDGYGPRTKTRSTRRGAGAALLHRQPLRLPQAQRRPPADQRRRRRAGRRSSRTSRRASPPRRRLTFKKGAAPATSGNRRRVEASLGTMPSYVGGPGQPKGVLLSDVVPGGPPTRRA